MKFTRNDIYIGMKYYNSNDTLVEIKKIDEYIAITYSKEWGASYPIDISDLLQRINKKIYTLHKSYIKELDYEIY